VVRAAAIAAVLASACATFEDPTIVLDTRVIAMTARTPEHVIDVDLAHPPDPSELLAQLNREGPQEVCGTVADPGPVRGLRWSMVACGLDENHRCDPARPRVPLEAGRLADPEAARSGLPGFTGGTACTTFEYDDKLLALLVDLLRDDPARALGGLDYAVEFRVGAEDQPIEHDLFAAKQIRIAPRIPVTRQANKNPEIVEMQIAINYGGGFPNHPKHCADPPGDTSFDIEVESGDVVTLYPVEGDGAREHYVVPTLDGQFEKFTENMTYQWLTTAGSFSDDITGGPPDIFGNVTLLGTDWTAPQVSSVTELTVWVVQRDERFGASMHEVCMRVTP
jgi:hypothetical protein